MSPQPASIHELNEKAAEAAAAAPVVDAGLAPNVVVALLRVMRDLPGIGKDQTAAAQQGGYPYRGIEQITQHTQPLFARHGIVFAPRVVHHEIRDLTVNNKPWTDTVELVEYDVYGPGGADDRITIGPILAIGRDNSDKGANKCMTQAFKYALLQALCISDAKDDGDGQTHVADAPPQGQPLMSKDEAVALVKRLAKGNAEKAHAAWTAIWETPWTPDALTAAYEQWVERDPAEQPGEPVEETT